MVLKHFCVASVFATCVLDYKEDWTLRSNRCTLLGSFPGADFAVLGVDVAVLHSLTAAFLFQADRSQVFLFYAQYRVSVDCGVEEKKILKSDGCRWICKVFIEYTGCVMISAMASLGTNAYHGIINISDGFCL